MKKAKILFIIIISLTVISGCSTFSSTDTPPAQQEQINDNNTETSYDQGAASDKSEGSKVVPVDSDYKIDTGRFSGRADSNFIEIKISGVPEEMSYRMFMLSEDLKEEFDHLNLEIDQVIKFKYKINENDQGVIFEITSI